MNKYDAEISTLFVVEQHLQNAAVSLRAADRRLGDGQLREQIREILRSVEGTTDLTRSVKRIMLREWRAAEATPAAA